MENNNVAPLYWVWGTEYAAYGPMQLPVLIGRLKTGQVTGHHWIYCDKDNLWQKACQVPELKMFCPASDERTGGGEGAARCVPALEGAIPPGALRRIKLFADMEERQLESFVHYMEVLQVPQYHRIVRKGDHGDAMYLILSGELRALLVVDKKEATLSTMTTGDFFGEISLLDEGPRSADVVANEDSLLLKIPAASFRRLVEEAPALATPFLFALSRSVAGRLRHMTRRYQDSIHCLHLVNTYYTPRRKTRLGGAA
jgi:CRP-like cAMP-binding protein